MRTNPPLRSAILAAALVVFFALPSLASAGQVVPPGNSAATQYTQVFPTSDGNVAVGTSIGESGGGGGKKTPSKVIPKKTTEELESQGPEGTAVAQLAEESAPHATEPEPEPAESSNGGGDKSGAKDRQGDGKAKGDDGKEAGQNGATAGGNDKGGGGGQGGGANPVESGAAATEAAGSGSSGFSQVLGQATGSSAGQMGVFLPLVLLAALVMAIAYAWRRRQHEPKAIS
jgi:cobalamin biosynthesis Mg chelatase CobN